MSLDHEFSNLAVDVCRLSVSEEGLPRPKVGAVLVRDDTVIATAYRGELAPGQHAEFTLLEHKSGGQDLRGSTLFTTLEPCTTPNHPKKPCIHWIIDRGIGRVVIGMLDPNPKVYEQGVIALRAAGITVDFFTADLREALVAENAAFIDQFRSSPPMTGTVSFNFTHHDGRFAFGNGKLTFETRWSNASNSTIHIYLDSTNLSGVGVALSARTFGEVADASGYDMSSRVQTPREGEFVVLRNSTNQFAVLRIDDVTARSHGDPMDSVTVSYRINSDGSARFL